MITLNRPVTPHAMRLSPLLRRLVGPSLRAEADRLVSLYITGPGYRRALSAFVHRRRGLAGPFLWEVRDFVDRMPGDTLPEIYQNVIAGL